MDSRFITHEVKKTADLTVVQKTLIDTLHNEGKSQKVIAERAGCSQSAVWNHIHGKLTGWEKCGRKTCTSSRNDRSLEGIVKQSQFKNVGDLHKEWTEAGVSVSRTTMHRCVQEMGYKCHIPSVKSLLNQMQVKSVLSGLKRKRTGPLLNGPKSSFQVNFAFNLEIKVP